MTLLGLDVSTYQKPSDWSPVGLSFLIARSSIGTKADPQYPYHIAKAKAAGLVTGAYHFNWDQSSTTDPTPEEQARFFLATAGDVDLLFLDVEGTRAFEPSESQRFIAEVHKAGRKIGLYMSASSYREDGQDYDWIAKWSSIGPTAPDGHWEFWQYSDGGGAQDYDKFNGDAAALAAMIGDIVKIATKLERWVLDGGSARVTTLGAPVKADGSSDFSKRLAQMPDGSLLLIDRTRLGATPSYDATIDNGLRAALAAYALPVAGLTQAQLDAAVLVARQAQYDLDAKSIVATASAKLSDPRP